MRIEITNRPDLDDGRAHAVLSEIEAALPGLVADLRIVDVYCVPADFRIDPSTAHALFCDPVAQVAGLDAPIATTLHSGWDFAIEVSFKPGVTDPIGITATEALRLEKRQDSERIPLTVAVQSARQYIFTLTKHVERNHIDDLSALLHNPLIQRVETRTVSEIKNGDSFPPFYKNVHITAPENLVELFDVATGGDVFLMNLSRQRLLALTLEEMKVIQEHFVDVQVQEKRKQAGLSNKITDVELEMLAQTWSEHCKHKIFAAHIEYSEPGKEAIEQIPGLFSTYIKRTTDELMKHRSDLLSVFHDNAGVVEFDEEHVICFKAETHNSPSALDPYGGAITGIVGVNRDILGTGKGAKPIFNTNVLCFADPDLKKEMVPDGLLHPKRIMKGVHRGIVDGGNQSGIPTVAGAFVFDESYLGKPLVYCGTGGIMPRHINGENSWVKHVDSGDLAVMVGGRIGKDGIHGATFSSLALDEESPSSAVQIGDPITQRKVWDFLLEARDQGLYKGITDNGAGGLSSSLGEMAQASGGVRVNLELCPLKYPGLAPWEIWVSESQERMSLAVDPLKIQAFSELAKKRSVEVTVVGTFTGDGYIDLWFGDKRVGYLAMEFVHNGLPKMKLKAEWIPPSKRNRDGYKGIGLSKASEIDSIKDLWLRILSSPNVRSRESLVRQYDHEVQGNTLVKPYQGSFQDAPTDGGVIRPVPGSKRGITVTHGICPRIGDDDTYKMALSAVDEAFRAHIALGGDPERASVLDNFCWPDPVESKENPDGPYKLAQLVRANKGLRDACIAYGLPLISGKDSMKNDAKVGGKKISVRPTLLISLMGIVENTDFVPNTGFIRTGDTVYLVGGFGWELGGSILEQVVSENTGSLSDGLGRAPEVYLDRAKQRYALIHKAICHGLLRSIHDISEGGLATALVETCLHHRIGFLGDLDPLVQFAEHSSQPSEISFVEAMLFNESPSRFLVSVSAEKKNDFENLMRDDTVIPIGTTVAEQTVTIEWADPDRRHISFTLSEGLGAWKKPWQD